MTLQRLWQLEMLWLICLSVLMVRNLQALKLKRLFLLLYYLKFNNRVARFPHHIPLSLGPFAGQHWACWRPFRVAASGVNRLMIGVSSWKVCRGPGKHTTWKLAHIPQSTICVWYHHLKGCIENHPVTVCGIEAVVFAPQHGTRARPRECSLSRCYRYRVWTKILQIMKTLLTVALNQWMPFLYLPSLKLT